MNQQLLIHSNVPSEITWNGLGPPIAFRTGSWISRYIRSNTFLPPKPISLIHYQLTIYSHSRVLIFVKNKPFTSLQKQLCYEHKNWVFFLIIWSWICMTVIVYSRTWPVQWTCVISGTKSVQKNEQSWEHWMGYL